MENFIAFHRTHGKHWLQFKLATAVMIPLNIWLIVSVIAHMGDYHVVMREWVAQPLNSILLILNIILLFYHFSVCLSEVIIDYVGDARLRFISLLGLKVLAFVLGAACVWAVMYMAFT